MVEVKRYQPSQLAMALTGARSFNARAAAISDIFLTREESMVTHPLTEVKLREPVKATAVADAFAIDNHVPGSFTLVPEPTGSLEKRWGVIRFQCPCGCGSFYSLPIGLNTKPPKGSDDKATWQWDGNHEAPTLVPSIRHPLPSGGHDHWHGYLTAGFFVQA